MRKGTFLSLIISTMAHPLYPLVDYSGDEEVALLDPSPSESFGKFYSNVGYRQARVHLEHSTAKVNFVDLNGHFETNYNFYLNVHYWMASTDSYALVEDETGYQKGNPTVILGLNWFEVGSPSERATLGLIAGMSFGTKDSALATSRDDRHVGLVTKKRFGPLILGLDYTQTLTGTPRQEEEMAIGPIRKAQASLNWALDHTRLRFDVGTYTVETPDDGPGNRLQEKVSFGYLSPSATMRFAGVLNFNLGAIFRTKRSKEHSLVSSRSWNLRGAYGNSFFGGIHLSF